VSIPIGIPNRDVSFLEQDDREKKHTLVKDQLANMPLRIDNVTCQIDSC